MASSLVQCSPVQPNDTYVGWNIDGVTDAQLTTGRNLQTVPDWSRSLRTLAFRNLLRQAHRTLSLQLQSMLPISGILFRKLFTIVNGTATVVDIRPRNAGRTSDDAETGTMRTGLWSEAEHDRFLDGVAMYPSGPWDRIAAHVGTRTTKQTRIHAHKYCQKIERHLRGLQRGRGAHGSSAVATSEANASDATTNAADLTVGYAQVVDVTHGANRDVDDPDAIFTRLDDGEQLEVLPDDIDYATMENTDVLYDCEPLTSNTAPFPGSDDRLLELLFTPSTTSDVLLAWPRP